MALLRAIEQGKIGTVVVTEVSRLTRDYKIGIDIVDLARAAGGLVIYTTEGQMFDLMTNTGKHNFLEAVLKASRESGTTSDRVKRNKRNSAKEGRYHGGRRPFGRQGAIKDQFGRVTNTGDVGVLILEEEAQHIREAVNHILDDGWPLLSVVRDWKKRGINSPSGNAWSTSTFRKMLLSKHLKGVRDYHGKDYAGAFPCIIEPDRFDKLSALLTADERKAKPGQGVRSYLLTGFIFCSCGNKMGGRKRKRHGREVREYLCRPYDNFGEKVGCYRTRLADATELLVTDAVLYRYNSPAFVEYLKQAYEQDAESDGLADLLQQAKLKKQKLNELEDAWTDGVDGLDLATMLRLKAKTENELKQLNAQIGRRTSGKLLVSLAEGDIHTAWESFDLEQRRQIIGLIVERVVVLPQPQGETTVWTHEKTGQSWCFNPEYIQIKFKF